MTIAKQILKEINARLQFMVDVGLDYLTLDRPPRPHSGRRSLFYRRHADRFAFDGRQSSTNPASVCTRAIRPA
ncbi:MAG: hypothetical protein U0559_07990 [Anaerolineae bacterium]